MRHPKILSKTSFLLASGGNVGIFFALSLLPMIGLVGLGVDVGRTLEAKTTFDAAADAAALAAATAAQAELSRGGTQSTAQAAGRDAGQKIFGADVAKLGNRIGVPTPTVDVAIDTTTDPKSPKVVANVGYTAAVPTVIGQMFSTDKMTLARSKAAGNAATATIAVPKFMEISFAIDNSQSMGIAASTGDIDKMQSLTGCAFACHYSEDSGPSYETVARRNNVRLRIDSIKDATKLIVQTAQQEQTSFNPKRIAFNLFTMDAEKVNDTTLVPLRQLTSSASTDYTTILNQADGIDLASFGYSGRGETDLGASITALARRLPSAGDGTSADKPLRTVFIMTDGVDDLTMPQNAFACRSSLAFDSSHCTEPLNTSVCNQLKNKGITVGVIYTTYLRVPYYDQFVAPFAPEVVNNLKSCASGPEWFAEASDEAGIRQAVQNFYSMTKSAGVLTQ